MEYLLTKVREIDPKIVAVAVTYLLTLLVVKVIAPELGINPDGVLDTVLIPGYLSVASAIALVAGLVAGWWKANAATILRTEQESGNAIPPGEHVLGERGEISVVTVGAVCGIVALVLVIVYLA